MLGSLTTPNSARAHSAAVAEHDQAARAVAPATAKGAAASKVMTFQSFLEEKKGGSADAFPHNASAREDVAPPADALPEEEDEISDAAVETDSDFDKSGDVPAVPDWDDALLAFDGRGGEFSQFSEKDTSQSSLKTSVPDHLGAQSIIDSPRREGPAGIEASGITLTGQTANTLPQSEAGSQQAGASSVAPTGLAGTAAKVVPDLAPILAGQGAPQIVSDRAAESGVSIEAPGRTASVIVGEPKLREIVEPARLVLSASTGEVDTDQDGVLIGRPSAEAAQRFAADKSALPLAGAYSPLLNGQTAAPVEEVMPRSDQSPVMNGNSAQLRHAWPMTNAPDTAGFKITAAAAGLPPTDVIPGDAMAAVLDAGGDANLALEGSAHRAANEARTAPPMLQHGATTARNVAAQISEAMAKGAERSIDVILNPAELGRVRITLSHSDAGMVVNVAAERAETLDMMRRHSDLLGQEFTDLGYGGTDFTFAREDGSDGGDHSQKSGEAAPDASPAPESGTTIILRAAPADRLDIRL